MRKFFAVTALIISSQLHAQDTPKVLDEVVITTNKYPKKQSQTGKVITVIDQATIKRMGGRTVGEILNTVAGVTVNGTNNNLGTNQGISIRGSSFGNILLLIDGIPVNDPSIISNYFDLNLIDRDQIERIEILKGGQSTLYGSDAVAGVINIITKKADKKPVGVNVSAIGGSYGTFQGNVGVSGLFNKFSYNVQQGYIHSNGLSSAYDSTGKAGFDKDGYNQSVTRADVGYALSNHVSINAFGNYSWYKAGVDENAFQDDKDYNVTNKNIQTGLGLTWKQNNGNLHFNYNFNNVSRFYLDDSCDRSNPYSYFLKSKYIGRTHYAEVYENMHWNHWELLAGADYRYNNTNQYTEYAYIYNSTPYLGESTLPDSIAHAWQLSPYASIIYNNNGFNIELGGRWNHHSTYGNNFTYTFNPSYLVNNKVKLYVNASSAFKVPSLYQLYDPYSGNRDLKPERSATFEGGAEAYINKSLKFRVTGFYRSTKDAIEYIYTDPANYIAQYKNISNRKNSGIETELFFNNDKWNISANYTYTTGKITTAYDATGFPLGKDTSFNYLYRVPAHAANLFANYNITRKLSVGTLLKYVGSRLEPVYGAVPKVLDDYFTIDLDGQYHFNNHIRAFVDLKNITNQQFFDVLGYNSRRFNFDAGIAVQF